MSAAALHMAEVLPIRGGQVSGDRLPLMNAGIYELAFLYEETVLLGHGRVPKLILWFRVVTPGDYFGLQIPRYYNVERLEGKPRKYGNFKLKGWGNDFVRHFAMLFGNLPPRKDRIPMGRFEGVIVRASVKTIVTNWKQKALPAPLHYSIVDELLSVEAGGSQQTPPPKPSLSVTPSPTPSPTPTLKYEAEGEKV